MGVTHGNGKWGSQTFDVGMTDDGIYDKIMGTESARAMLDGARGLKVGKLPAKKRVAIDPKQLDRFDAVPAGGPLFTRESVSSAERCTLIVRFGAGYDLVDLDACTDAGIIVATTPMGIRRAMATAALTFILALSVRLFDKRNLVYSGSWTQADGPEYRGVGLEGRTLGYIGLGNIGQELHALIAPFGMKYLVYDPYLDDEVAKTLGVRKTDLDTLLKRSDFVSIQCLLTEETHHLIGARELELMKPTAYLINVARGAIVDQRALAEALAVKRIKGAGLDALEREPIDADDPLLDLDNVIVTPHALGYTDHMTQLCAEGCVQASLAVMRGEFPQAVINRDVLESPKLNEKLGRLRERYTALEAAGT